MPFSEFLIRQYIYLFVSMIDAFTGSISIKSQQQLCVVVVRFNPLWLSMKCVSDNFYVVVDLEDYFYLLLDFVWFLSVQGSSGL